ncbi:MAG: hypothetical protein OCD01_15145 [Fibrobacterales bacterium]
MTPSFIFTQSIILILILTSYSHALFIKSTAHIKDVSSGKVFAELYDSTYITQGISVRKKQPYIETKANLLENNIDQDFLFCNEGDVTTCHYQLLDTIALMSIEGDTIGKIWNPFGAKRHFPSIMDLRDDGLGLQVNIKGVINSSKVYDLKPWNSVIESVAADSLFNQTYYTISGKMKKIKTEFKDEFFEDFQSVSTYDRSLPTPKPTIQYFFDTDTLKAIWIDSELQSNNKVKFQNKWLYFDPSIQSKVNSVKEMICGSMIKKSGNIFQFNQALDRCK